MLQPKALPSPVRRDTATRTSDETVVRRSANYPPPRWTHDFLQSLQNKYSSETQVKEKHKKLKEQVKKTLTETEDCLDQLELIDTLERLGISYHVENEIEKILKNIYDSNIWIKDHLHATAIGFRILRQHGFNVPQEVFNVFKDESGRFRASLQEDTKGLLSLYEASYLSKTNDTTLKEAREFAMKILKEFVGKRPKTTGKESYVAAMVSHALEMPLRWRIRRLESRCFIDVYGQKHNANPLLLEFAKLDFNLVQAVHQEDLKFVSRWWRKTGLAKQLNFARDRITELYFWTVGMMYEPQFGYFRQMFTKITALITTIDDIYDVYGTVMELELFTEAVDRWDVSWVEKLPEYMRQCFLVLYNDINQMGLDTLEDKGFNAIPCFKKAWADLCKSYLLEAKWYHSGYKPSLSEYLENACVSIAVPLMLVHACCFLSDPISKHTLDSLSEGHPFVRWSATALRLADDLGTSPEELTRGDVPKSIQCHMYATGVSEAEARAYIQGMVSDAWDKMNEETMACSSPFTRNVVETAINAVRMSLLMYQHGDGYGAPGKEIEDCVLSLFVQPVSLD